MEIFDLENGFHMIFLYYVDFKFIQIILKIIQNES